MSPLHYRARAVTSDGTVIASASFATEHEREEWIGDVYPAKSFGPWRVEVRDGTGAWTEHRR